VEEDSYEEGYSIDFAAYSSQLEDENRVLKEALLRSQIAMQTCSKDMARHLQQVRPDDCPAHTLTLTLM
jgi:hypothetical protein